MAIKSNTIRGNVTTTSYTDILTNNNLEDSLYIGQIDIINPSATALNVTVSLLSQSTNYILITGIVNTNGSRLSDERKIPYELKPGEKIQAKLLANDATGCTVHISYI